MFYGSMQQLRGADGVGVAPQGQTGGEGVATQPATHGVWEGEFFLPTLKRSDHAGLTVCLWSFVVQILPGVRIIIANPETKGPMGESHLGEVRQQRSFFYRKHMTSV